MEIFQYIKEKINFPFQGKRFNVGIVLSGGAARGFAHVGALKALNEAGIFPQIISSVSAGSIVGSLYADGYTPDEIIELFLMKRLLNFASFQFPSDGLMKAEGLMRLLTKQLKSENIEDLRLPTFIGVTNFQNGTAEYLRKGNLVQAIMASSGIPVLFPPRKINNIYYVDGGIVDNMPISPIKNLCKKVIGIHVNPIDNIESLGGIRDIAIRTFHMAVAAQINDEKKALFDMFIEPFELRSFGLMEVSKGEKMYNIGYEYTKAYLKEVVLDDFI